MLLLFAVPSDLELPTPHDGFDVRLLQLSWRACSGKRLSVAKLLGAGSFADIMPIGLHHNEELQAPSPMDPLPHSKCRNRAIVSMTGIWSYLAAKHHCIFSLFVNTRSAAM